MDEHVSNTSKRRRAVALRYEQGQDEAPRVIAKGHGVIAERIIAIAEAHQILLYQDPDLVEILCTIDLGHVIPPELYKAVAEVLAFVYRMNGKFQEAPNR